MAAEAQTIGSAGTLVGAGMETAGHFLQSDLLDAMSQGLSGALGVFYFTVAAVTGILIIAVGGRYKFGLWFLIGPTLFYLTTVVRIPSSGVQWQVGNRAHDQRLVKEATVGVYGGAGTVGGHRVGEVSTVFALWDRITSGIVQTVIRVLNLTDLQADLDFITKTGKYMSLFALKVDDAVLHEFLHTVTIDQCHRYYTLQLELIDEGRVVPEGEVLAEIAAVEKEVVFTSADPAGERMKSLATKGYLGSPPPALKDAYTCRDVWDLSKLALQTYAYQQIVAVAGKNLPPELPVDDAMKTLAKKFVADGTTDGEVVQMVNAIATRLLAKEMAERSPGLSQLNIMKNIPIGDVSSVRLARDRADVESDLRAIEGPMQYKGFGEYFSLIMALPYAQGVALLFLGMLYPLFCFMLIVPGRHHTFFLWMGLWFWVKSWDMGFAVVMLVDELLYYLLPVGPAVGDGDMATPAKAFKLVLRADPTYAASTYYLILSGLMGGMIILLGVFVRRAGGEVMDFLSEGFQGLSGQIGGALQSYAGSMRAQENLAKIEQLKLQGVQSSAAQLLTQDREMQRLLGVGPNASFQDMATAAQKIKDPGVRRLIETKMNLAASLGAFRAGTSPEADRLTEQNILLGQYNRSPDAPVPKVELLEMKTARADLQYGAKKPVKEEEPGKKPGT